MIVRLLQVALCVLSVDGQQVPVPTLGPYCTPEPDSTPGPNEPRLPELPPAFQTKIELNIENKHVTIDADEYNDPVNKRAYLRLMQFGVETKTYVNLATNEAYIVYGHACKVQQLNESDFGVMFGDVVIDGKRRKMFSVSSLFKFGKQFGQKYMGRTKARGIDVNYWRSCQQWQYPPANMTVDYYFTALNWSSSFDGPSIPVRAVVEGISNDKDIPHYFRHTYDFVQFTIPIEQDDKLFDTPPGVYCEGRKKTKPLPNLPKAFSYREEIVSPDTTNIQFADVYYDYNYKLVRFDNRNPVVAPPYYTTGPIVEIHDYTTGVSYARDVDNGNCTIAALTDNFDNTLSPVNRTKDPGYVLRMRRPLELLFLDDTYVYIGKRIIRSVPCDVFSSRRSDFKLPDTPAFNTTFEIYFMSDEFFQVSTGNSLDSYIPMRLEIWGEEIDFHAIYNIFDFAKEDPDLSKFDITACFPPEVSKSVQITFPGPYYPYIGDDPNYFTIASILQLTNIGKITPIRVQQPKVTYDDNNVYLTATLLERPPYYALFSAVEQSKFRLGADAVIPDIDLSDCQQYCQDETDGLGNTIVCNSLDYCDNLRTCSLSTTHTGSDPKDIKTNPGCTHYSRNVDARDQPSRKLLEAWGDIKEAIYRGSFIINVPVGDVGTGVETIAYTASRVREGLIRGKWRDLPGRYTRRFNVTRGVILGDVNINILDVVTSVDDCARACVTDTSISCLTFNYCYDEGVCMTSGLHMDDNPILLANSSGCDLYSRDYLSQYNGYPGLQVFTQNDVILYDIVSVSACAHRCSNWDTLDEGDFDCKSFDYCSADNSCGLNKGHFFEFPFKNKTSQPTCQHWSRNYLADFELKQQRVVPLKNTEVYKTDIENCAKLCVGLGGTCKGFDYCKNVSECVLTTELFSKIKIGQTVPETQAYCSRYSRSYYPDGSDFNPGATKYVKVPEKGGFSAGAMAGVGVGMVVLGAVLGVAIIFIVNKVRGPAKDGMGVHFVNNPQ
ncbi:unnamed protein product [Owenia fusiformis]|uniref:Apple domain-containing protein n=1 Tax=Owenia fusiformis TaxID=6347 RepID=A0A8S4MX64_OWEFU|nr:unnamed protein product [Owenia fusiformis]